MALFFGLSVPLVQSTKMPSMSATCAPTFIFSDKPVGPNTPRTISWTTVAASQTWSLPTPAEEVVDVCECFNQCADVCECFNQCADVLLSG